MDGGISPWAIYFSYLCIEVGEGALIVQVVSTMMLIFNFLFELKFSEDFKLTLYILMGVSSVIEVFVPSKEVILAMIQANSIPPDNIEIFRKEVIDMLKGIKI